MVTRGSKSVQMCYHSALDEIFDDPEAACGRAE